MKPCIVDATTGELIDVELFVAVLGASNYTFGESEDHPLARPLTT